MSAEMASSICVGTSTLSHQNSPHSQKVIVASDDLEKSSNVDVNKDDRVTSFNANLAVVADMDLVNCPNPWLPAYGFQLQQHTQHFQPTHEDLRANDPAIPQQGDFLETILEETSDDLQSDSDRSGTTYWLGSESETESVIHIKANQRAAEERPDGSGSECNSVVPKKRRRRNASKDRDVTLTLNEDHWASPRSSRSSESSSRSSSLLQFESLERTCATVSPSGYSYDSLEYSNRSNTHFENTSPDSLEEDCEDDSQRLRNSRSNTNSNASTINGRNGFGNLRPYRSFESLDTCHKNDHLTTNDLTNGFSTSFYSKTSNDLTAGAIKNDRGHRDFWHENYEEEEYEYEDDDEEEEEEAEDDDDEDTLVNRDSRIYEPYEDRGGTFGSSNLSETNLGNYSSSLDYRNTTDLREIGLSRAYDFKSLQQQQGSPLCGLVNSASSRMLQSTRLNIVGVEEEEEEEGEEVEGVCGGISTGCISNKMASSNDSVKFLQHHHHHHHHHHSHSHNHSHNSHKSERGWSCESLGFNFRTTLGAPAEKCLSAPSLGSDVEDSISRCYAFGRGPRSSGASFGTVSSTDLFENYTRVASVPVDLNLCGKNEEIDQEIEEEEENEEENEEEDVTLTNDDNILHDFDIKSHKMADDSVLSEQSSCESTSKSLSDKEDSSSPRHSDEKSIKASVVRTSSVRTQIRPEIAEVNSDVARNKPSQRSINIDPESSAKMETNEATSSEPEDEDTVLEDESLSDTREAEPPKSTVKTQDRGGNNVLEMALAMENDIDAVVDEAIRQFKREVEEATGSGNETAILALEAVQRLGSEKQQQQRAARRVKNNASYELAQQFEVNENHFLQRGKMTSCLEDDSETPTPSSPTNSGRRRVLNNASYELAQQTDYMKLLQKNSRPFHRMDACDERPEVPRPGITCGDKVADIVREMSKDPGTSSFKDSTTSNHMFENDRKNDIDNKQRSPGRYHENHVTNSSGKNYECADGESMICQIKKNSDPFSLYGESGKAMGRTLGSVEGENEDDDEIDYPCLEVKSIIEPNAFPGDVLRPIRRRKSNEMWQNDEISTSFNEQSLAERGLTFLGDFYPETKNHLARGVEFTAGKDTEKLEDEKKKNREPIGSQIERKQRSSSFSCSASPSSSSGSPSSSSSSSSSSACKSRSLESEERGTVQSIESVAAQETTVSLPSTVLEGEMEEKSKVMEKEEEEASSNVLELEKEKEAKRSRRRRRKECAYVETGGPNSAASCVHAVTPATSSPPRPVTSHAVYSDDPCATEVKERLEPHDNFSDRIFNDSADQNKHHDEFKRLLNHENDPEFEKYENTKKTTINNAEMSATAAKRLAMASGPPRNNNEPSNNHNKSPIDDTSKNIHLGSPGIERKKSGLGGFLQRFSRLRFSGRSKVPRSEINKKFNSESTSVEPFNSHKKSANVHTNDQQTNTTRRKEPDYIIIPLHGPEDETNKLRSQDEQDFDYKNKPRRSSDLERSASCASPNGRPLVSSKPPLPPSHHQSGVSGGGGSGGSSSSSSVGARNIGATMTTTTRCVSGTGGVVGNTRRRAATDLGSPAAIEMAKARAMQAAQEPRPVGLLETDLDAAEPAIRHVNLNTINGASATSHPHNNSHISTSNNQPGKKTRSLLNLNHTSARQGREVHHHLNNENELRVPHSPTSANRNNSEHHQDHHNSNQRPHKSMEFLLDKENLHFVKPPENELQKVGERVPSEHELRVQRSLQRLNVPDWYKNSPAARDGFRLKRHSDASQHSGWRSLGSKTTSLSSLSSSSNRQPTTGVLLSPSPTPPVFSRWSTSLLNSAGSSPASSARSSFNHRQPYLGWRSQERLANPRTPAERLAQGILPQLQSAKKQQQQQQQQQQQTNQQLEVRNSIKEVTSAIVHYVQSGQEVAGGGRLSPRPRPDDWDDRGGARSTSPRGSVKLCWMESSFVGSRPVDSPETPMSLATDTECCAGCNATGTESCSCVDSATSGLYLDLTPTRDEPQRHRGGLQQQQQQQQPPPVPQHGSRSQCPSPSPTLNYHQPIHHHVHQQQQQQHRLHRGSGQSEDEEAMATAALLRNKPSPGSTTLEDVLDSLLGLPSASRTPSPGPGPISASTSIRHQRTSNTGSPAGQTTNTKAGKSCSDLRQDLQESVRVEDDSLVVKEVGGSRGSPYYVGELVRRKSEGSDIVPPHRSSSRGSNVRNRRVSFDGGQQQQQQQQQNSIENNGLGVQLGEKLVRCRNNKCNNTTTVAEARRVYKSCHNCTCLYCSRECRRAHWQRHRRTCLHSRAGTLCRQVLSSAKEDSATLKHISALAQRGYASHGRGAVKCFFTSPEIAEQFVSNGFVDLGEPTYVKWSELLPSEMGAELYAEVIRLCKSYNPETRLVLYVAVCVVSEVPSSGAVRWERQLVSRCGKIRLDTSCRQPIIIPPTSNSASPGTRTGTTSPCNITREMDSPETLVLTSMPGTDGQNTPRSSREIGFTNIQRQLRLRGVSLRRHFPQVYTKLCSYVDGTVDKFAPVTIYPRDQASGKSFMCIIMLDAEPERLQLLPTDSSRVRTVDISVEQE